MVNPSSTAAGARLVVATASVMAASAVLAGCGAKPQQPAGNAAPNARHKACMVTDSGGIDDKSFNASAWAGMKAAQASGKAVVRYVQSKSESDYTPNINNLVSQRCQIIVTVGGIMAQATTDAAKANPHTVFAQVDAKGNGKNLRGLLFNAVQGGFLAGYLAAGYTKSGKVATYGGLKIPTVTDYMDGFWEGVQYYNKVKHRSVETLGWSEKTQQGTFAGGFTDQTKGSQLAKNFIQQGADVILPVAGGTALGTAAQVKASGGAVVIWVDSDGCLSAPQYCSVFLSTAYKDVKGAVEKTISDAAAGTPTTGDYIGDLADGGVGLTSFHEFAGKVPQSLQSELAQLKQDIVAGKITLTSLAQPKA